MLEIWHVLWLHKSDLRSKLPGLTCFQINNPYKGLLGGPLRLDLKSFKLVLKSE